MFYINLDTRLFAELRQQLHIDDTARNRKLSQKNANITASVEGDASSGVDGEVFSRLVAYSSDQVKQRTTVFYSVIQLVWKASCHTLPILGPSGPAVHLRYLDRVHIIAVSSKPV